MSKFETEVRAFFEGLRETIGDDTHVWSKAEWAKRGEQYGNTSPFVITTEGPFYEMYNYGTYADIPVDYADKLRAIAKRHGYYFEQGYAWMISPYRSN